MQTASFKWLKNTLHNLVLNELQMLYRLAHCNLEIKDAINQPHTLFF